MPENQDKKISYKILTAEELLSQEAPLAKEDDHKKASMVGEEKIKPTEELISTEPSIHKVEIPVPKATEISSSSIELIKEESPKEEILYAPQEKLPSETKSELLRKEIEKEAIPEEAYKPVSPVKTKREFKLSSNLYRFLLFGGGIILVFLLILFLKPQEKFKSMFGIKGEEKKEEFTTSTVILFPKITSTVVSIPTTSTSNLESPVTEVSVMTQPQTTSEISTATQSTPSQAEIESFKEIPFLENFSSKEINLENLDFSTWQEEFEKFLSLQESAGIKINVNFLYNKNKVPFSFLFDYFIKPTKI